MKSNFNILIMLLFSWSVYGSCQNDMVLPVLGGAVLVISLLLRLRSAEKQFAVFEQIPLSVIIIVSAVAGLFWRNFVPIPEDVISPYPEYAAALQSGSIVAAAIFWLRPLTQSNRSRLIFCAWLTVALSMNVPFDEQRLMIFSAFCFISIAIVVLNTMKKPADRKYRFMYIRDYIVFSTLLIMLTTVLFLGIATSVVVFERAFMNTMSGLIMPRQYTNFLRLSPKLNLISPGLSAFDRRPVLEMKASDRRSPYLKLQVFDFYHNGTWLEPKYVKKDLIPTELVAGQPKTRLTMFTSFEKVVPSPGFVTGVKTKTPYLLSEDHILYAQDEQHTRILEFSLLPRKSLYMSSELSPAEYEKYTRLPPSLAPQLKEIAHSVTNGEGDIKVKADKLLKYFHQNFSYSLEVSFSADDQGLLKMLNEKRPAYCTYFASALTLLLRAEGIPARVAAGFMATEVIDSRSNTYLVRVNNAHAWTEVFAFGFWQPLDATPPSFAAQLNKKNSFNLERVFENFWLGVLRFNAWIENMDKDKLKLYMVLGLLGLMTYINRQKILKGLAEWVKNKGRSKKVYYQTTDILAGLYRRYEVYLKEKYGETRNPSDTDFDVVMRLKGRTEIDPVSLGRIEHFVKEFQSARFGTKPAENLQSLVEQFKG